VRYREFAWLCEAKVAQAGFATSEPYIYQHEVKQWGKPVKYALVNEAGYPFYPQACRSAPPTRPSWPPASRSWSRSSSGPRSTSLPTPQQTNALVLDLVKQYNDG
jgi:hypothetical protein